MRRTIGTSFDLALAFGGVTLPPDPTEFDRVLHKYTRLHMEGKRDDAYRGYMKLLPHNPNHPFLLFALGTWFSEAGADAALAIPLLMRSVEHSPEHPQAWSNLGAVFKAQQSPENAIACLTEALKLDPENGPAYANLSGCYINEGCPGKCVPVALKGLEYDPESPQLHNHLALAYLELGEWEKAWPHWAWRTRLPDWFRREFPEGVMAPWDGSPTDTLVLSGEQGIGDEIMFTSCIPEIRGRVRRLVIECTERLQPLFERTFDCVTYPSHQDVLMHEHGITAGIQMGSVPSLLYKSPYEVPGEAFLVANPEWRTAMRERLEAMGPPPYVGLAWRGGTTKTHGHVRQVDLRMLRDLKAAFEEGGATVVSVQYGPCGPEAASEGLVHWPDAVVDFDAHTALIAECDLVVSVCQTGVHQSGALGVPCWCLTPHQVAWRYGCWGGERMAWYKSVRLWRQTPEEAGQWAPVIGRMTQAVPGWLEEWRR